MNKTLEKQLLAIVEVIKTMQKKVDNAVSYDNEIKELQTLIDKNDNTNNIAFKGILTTLEKLNDKVDKDTYNTNISTLKSELKALEKTLQSKIDVKGEIDKVIKDYATKNELNEVLNKVKVEKIVETIKEETKFIEPIIKIGKVKTIQAGAEASVEIRKVKDTYYLDFLIPRGVSGRGMAGRNGEGIATGGTTNQVLAKKSNTDYDTKWVDNTGGTGTSDHSELTKLDYASAGHTGFQPTLVSGTSIKTINNTTLLGSGNITITGGDSRSIETIVKTGTVGLVDTYTITYSDETTSTFNITNGADGEDGAAGTNGTNGVDGDTPYIESGYWYIDGTSTGVLATGPQGEQGIQGPSGTNGIDGIDGTDAAEITSAAFDGNDIKFTKDDATTFSLTDAKITLKGEKGATGATGATGAAGADGADGADGLTTSVNGVTQVAGAITIDPDDLDDTLTAHKFVTATDLTNLTDLTDNGATTLHKHSYNNLDDKPTIPTLPVKATGAEINAGTDDAKFVTSKAISDSTYVVGPASATAEYLPCFNGTTGKLLKQSYIRNHTGGAGFAYGIQIQDSGPLIQRLSIDEGVTYINRVTLLSTPVLDVDAANKAYVDDSIGAIDVPTQYTDEMAQDAVGTILTDSTEIDFTYTDATPSITASIKSASIDESKLDTSVNASLDLADTALQSIAFAEIGLTSNLSFTGTNQELTITPTILFSNGITGKLSINSNDIVIDSDVNYIVISGQALAQGFSGNAVMAIKEAGTIVFRTFVQIGVSGNNTLYLPSRTFPIGASDTTFTINITGQTGGTVSAATSLSSFRIELH